MYDHQGVNLHGPYEFVVNHLLLQNMPVYYVRALALHSLTRIETCRAMLAKVVNAFIIPWKAMC